MSNAINFVADGTIVTTAWLADVNNFVYKTFNQTATELAAGVTPVSAQYLPGNVFRYLPATQIAAVQPNSGQDCTAAIQNAVKGTTGVVYFPTGFYYISSPIYITSGSAINLQLVGESRTNTIIFPSVTNLADGNGINAMFINAHNNGKLSMSNIRFSSSVNY